MAIKLTMLAVLALSGCVTSENKGPSETFGSPGEALVVDGAAPGSYFDIDGDDARCQALEEYIGAYFRRYLLNVKTGIQKRCRRQELLDGVPTYVVEHGLILGDRSLLMETTVLRIEGAPPIASVRIGKPGQQRGEMIDARDKRFKDLVKDFDRLSDYPRSIESYVGTPLNLPTTSQP